MQPAAIQWEMLGLAQPVIRMDGMQRMSMMMAMLVLGPAGWMAAGLEWHRE